MEAVIGLGSNMGQRKRKLTQAHGYISQKVGEIIKKSSYYETEPWGDTDQPFFLNQAIVIQTQLEPEELLLALKSIEIIMGRKNHKKWSARPIDMDILFYESITYDSSTLSIPHPLLHERNFVLIPLVEIIPEFIHPRLQLNIEELYIRCLDQSEVIIYSKA